MLQHGKWQWKLLSRVWLFESPYSPWNSPGQNTGVGSLSLPQGNLPNPGIEPRFPALQADSLPAEPPGKPRNTGVGSPSLLRWIFLTQESNWGLLHHRWILYQLSYQGSPILHMIVYIYVNPSLSVHPVLHSATQVCSLCLHLKFCPANRFISTIFLDSIYMC